MKNTVSEMLFMCLCCCRCYVLDLAKKIIFGIGYNLLIRLVTLVLIPSAYLTSFMRLYCCYCYVCIILENNRICNDFSVHVIDSVLSAQQILGC